MAEVKQYCPLCRAPQRDRDTVRQHLIVDHKREPSAAAEMMARFDTATPIPQAEEELTIWGVPVR